MIKHLFFSFFILVIGFSYGYTQTTWDKQWSKADSLLQKGLPQSAAKIAESILEQAKKKKDKPNTIKAQLFLMTVKEAIEEDADIQNIQEAEQQIRISAGEEKALWQSIAAETYWRYFQRNRWKLYDRTKLAGTVSTDIQTWDAAAFFEKIADLYQASLSDPALLQKIPVEKYMPLILEGKNTRPLRPTLYDLLAFRALDFFQNQEKDVTQPADVFQIEGSLWFEDAKRFSDVKVNIKNPASLHFKALHLYQDVIAFHLKDKTPEALIDADLHRLYFVHQNSIHPDKDSLYLNALHRIVTSYPNSPAVAEVSFQIAQQQYRQNQSKPPVPLVRAGKQDPISHKRDVVAIQANLKAIVAKFPHTEGGSHAAALLAEIESKNLSIQTEEVLIPRENIRAYIQYKNVDQITLHLYRVASEVGMVQRNDQKKLLNSIGNQKPLRTWQQALPGSEDLEAHATEIKIDALPSGNYIIAATTSKDSPKDSSLLVAAPFQVSQVALIINNQNPASWVYALDRASGQPLPHTQLTFWKQEWQSAKQTYRFTKIGSGKTDAAGKYRFYNNSSHSARWVTLVSGTDTLQSYFSPYAYIPSGGTTAKNKQKTFFFTDRAIYRPGQTIYFKGIMIEQKENGRLNQVIPNQSTQVTFYDVNQQKIETIEVKTNEYGSFTGTFTAPEGLLTGNMRIANETGSAHFSVEEYKRPKFYVSFDSLKTQYSLNENITITGRAKAYAGQTLDGAQVNYRVVRRARFPYFWAYYRWGMPSSPEMVITHGVTETKADGSFDVSFTTTPDKTIDPDALPIFTYAVYADVTDINGETRSGTENVQAGYRSLQIHTEIPEKAISSQLDTIQLWTQNLNGVFTAASIQVSIHPLLAPEKLFRQRLWETPDQFVYSETEFHQLFPNDAYKNEDDYQTWEKGPKTFERQLMTTRDGALALPAQAWPEEGWYVIEIETQDKQGREILEKRYCYVVDPQSKAPAQLPIVSALNQEQFEPGDQATLWLKTAFQDAYVFESNSRTKDGQAPEQATPIFRKRITEEDRGDIAFSWTYLYQNRVYTASQRISVPWTHRDLQIEWATHRDKLKPGEEEEWTFTIKGHKKEQVAAEILTALYDASLDAFRPHQWDWDTGTPTARIGSRWNTSYGFGISPSFVLRAPTTQELPYYEKRYDALRTPYNAFGNKHVFLQSKASGIRIRGITSPSATKDVREEALFDAMAEDVVAYKSAETAPNDEQASDLETIPIRTNLQETAYFFPQLKTDPNGDVTFSFTMPEALTEWKMQAFAHTKDWKTGLTEGRIKTQKDLMVMPNLPRFVRQGDRIELRSKISNLSTQSLSGVATIQVLDAMTMAPITESFGLKTSTVSFEVAQDGSTSVAWPLQIPENRYTPILIRITAKAGNFSDGEENAVPVVTNRSRVTETLPLPVQGTDEKRFTFDKLLQANSSTIVQEALTVEFTSNPAWYAVQALPYLTEYPYECAEQTFNRYYANAIAGFIVDQSPKIKDIFKQWEASDTSALISNLEKNPELKSALLAETPWVSEAKNETDQKKRIAELFNAYRLAKDLKKNSRQLQDMQLPEGGFPWFKGMYHNRYITQYIVTGIGRLQHLQAAATHKDMEAIVQKALPFLDHLIQEDYDRLIKQKADLAKQHIGYNQIYYLYMRSFFLNHPVPPTVAQAFEYYKNQATQYWNAFNPYMKGQIALALKRYGDAQTAEQIVASLKETAIQNKEMGMYWKNIKPSYWWHEAPIEAHSLLIETFQEIGADNMVIDKLKTWLLKQKQTQSWGTTKATADACYALLLTGSDWLTDQPAVTIRLGNEIVRSSTVSTEAGTGYFKKRFEGNTVTPEMGHIRVKVNQTDNEGTRWGAVYWQYFEDLDKITSAETPLSIKKQLFIERNTDQGAVLTEITDDNALNIGDKVRVQIEIRSDRDMEFVHLKDMRASTFEPVNVLSQYKYQGGLGYYESTKDLATHFFFDYLRKGTYVFEYTVFVNQKGVFSNGIATIQCMYAPEFSSHSEGIRVQIP